MRLKFLLYAIKVSSNQLIYINTIYLLFSGIAEQQKALESHLIREFMNKNVEISWKIDSKFSIYINFLTYIPFIEDCEKVFVKIQVLYMYYYK